MSRKLSLYVLPFAAMFAFLSVPQRAVGQTGPEPPPTDPPPPPKPPTPPVPPLAKHGTITVTGLVTTVLSLYSMA